MITNLIVIILSVVWIILYGVNYYMDYPIELYYMAIFLTQLLLIVNVKLLLIKRDKPSKYVR